MTSPYRKDPRSGRRVISEDGALDAVLELSGLARGTLELDLPDGSIRTLAT